MAELMLPPFLLNLGLSFIKKLRGVIFLIVFLSSTIVINASRTYYF